MPAMVADQMPEVFESGCRDGFVASPVVSPIMFEEFGRPLVPIL